MNKKIILIILILTIILIGVIFVFSVKKEREEEILPEEEIAVSQERKTMVSLYFRNKSTNQ